MLAEIRIFYKNLVILIKKYETRIIRDLHDINLNLIIKIEMDQ